MRFQVPPGLSRQEVHVFQVALWSTMPGVLVHGAFIGMFAWLGIPALALFNVFSTMAWVFISVDVLRWNPRRAFILALIELAAHAFLATLYTGAETGFWLPMLILPTILGAIPTAMKRLGALGLATGTITLVASLTVGLFIEPLHPVDPTLARLMMIASVLQAFSLTYSYTRVLQHSTSQAEDALASEKERSEGLLHNILPVEIAERLKGGEEVIADHHPGASVLFADLVGSTGLSERLSPEELVQVLDHIFRDADALVDELGLEKIKTIGDAYMVAAGVPTPRDDHAEVLTRFGAGLIDIVARHRDTYGLQVRVGIHSGPVVAGVIGRRKFAYDLWGDTVNTAARMESHGVPGRVQISEATRTLLADHDVEERGEIDVKGKGPMQVFLI